jgi:hypothetical protein
MSASIGDEQREQSKEDVAGRDKPGYDERRRK